MTQYDDYQRAAERSAEKTELRAALAALSRKNAKLWVAATKFLNEQTEENANALSLALTDGDSSMGQHIEALELQINRLCIERTRLREALEWYAWFPALGTIARRALTEKEQADPMRNRGEAAA